MDLCWIEPARNGDRGSSDADEGGADEDRGEEKYRRCHQLDLAEADPQNQQSRRDAEGGPASAGWHQVLTPLPGTGTPPAMPSTISSRTAPRICASGRKIMR